MNKLQIENRAVTTLREYENNSRTHDDAQVEQVAASIKEFGFTNPLLIDTEGVLIAGHGRLMAARKLGLVEVPCIVLGHLSEVQKRAYVIADNKLAEQSGWDEDMLARELAALADMEYDAITATGFNDDELSSIVNAANAAGNEGLTDPDDAPEVNETAPPSSKEGDVWLLGQHRVMCGDSTNSDDVARLLSGEAAALIHADPPYGMGKEGDGVANDNLYRDKLDDFQKEWWRAFRAHLTDNASAYIWGNAPDLWRLWYVGGLGESEKLLVRNEIVWDKSGENNPTLLVCGATFKSQHKFTNTERCLFFMLGEQFIGSINAEDYPEQYEPIRSYLAAEAENAGIGSKDIRRLCGCQMYAHWFTKSQFTFIPEKHYLTLRSEYSDNFKKPWHELKRLWDSIKGAGRSVNNEKLGQTRSFFDSTHCTTTDVWKFDRVKGDERYDHATPKPVAMMERVMLSSLPDNGLCVEPFGGSGSTLMGAERTGRRCYSMELQSKYCDVIVKRWQDYTGREATLEGDGRTFNEIARAREAA